MTLTLPGELAPCHGAELAVDTVEEQAGSLAIALRPRPQQSREFFLCLSHPRFLPPPPVFPIPKIAVLHGTPPAREHATVDASRDRHCPRRQWS